MFSRNTSRCLSSTVGISWHYLSQCNFVLVHIFSVFPRLRLIELSLERISLSPSLFLFSLFLFLFLPSRVFSFSYILPPYHANTFAQCVRAFASACVRPPARRSHASTRGEYDNTSQRGLFPGKTRRCPL